MGKMVSLLASMAVALVLACGAALTVTSTDGVKSKKRGGHP
jgi:hypothetical protein